MLKISNSYHGHKRGTWFVSDLFWRRVSSGDIWIFPVKGGFFVFYCVHLYCSLCIFWANISNSSQNDFAVVFSTLWILFTCKRWRGRCLHWAHCSSCPPCYPPQPLPDITIFIMIFLINGILIKDIIIAVLHVNPVFLLRLCLILWFSSSLMALSSRTSSRYPPSAPSRDCSYTPQQAKVWQANVS